MGGNQLRVTRTNSSDGYEGSFLGIEMIHAKWFALTLLVGISVFAGLFYGFELEFTTAGQWAVIPTIACLLYVRFALQGRPPGFVQDLFNQLMTGGHCKPNHKSAVHPFLHE